MKKLMLCIIALAALPSKTAWAIPDDPPAPPKPMAADANPVFEVATIKPSTPEEGFSILIGRRGAGANSLSTTNTSLSDLIKFAYDLHLRQITGGPAWFETEKYDVTGKPDLEGIPSLAQLRMMVQKLLADRFHLTFHRDKKELSAYAITVAKTGVKVTKDEDDPNGLPLFGGSGVRGLHVRNATLAEFASWLQAETLDRPVVDQTGLASARYDFILKWTPDASQGLAADPDAPPDLFTAFQEQLGLKLESTKAPVDVLVIDRVDKPSAN